MAFELGANGAARRKQSILSKLLRSVSAVALGAIAATGVAFAQNAEDDTEDEIVVTGMHGDPLFDALEEVVSSCPTQHETQVKHARLENQQPNIMLESHQINAALATVIKVIMADVITLWALHDVGLPLRGIRAYVPVRTICS